MYPFIWIWDQMGWKYHNLKRGEIETRSRLITQLCKTIKNRKPNFSIFVQVLHPKLCMSA